ncbi:MAG TPA: hypothetical protein VNT26_21100 [Candidatus Sulfotelmatobacter sp.]|nr:hypothetical protein [Candidatus Sulfotelmatobacter sp.]HWI56924.1 hypothetical protein [Bacillota bacterium]
MQEKTGNGHNVEIEQFLEDIKTVLRDGQKLLQAGVESVKEQARAGAAKTGQIARERPYQTLGMAFGVGLLAGVLVSTLFSRGAEGEEG